MTQLHYRNDDAGTRIPLRTLTVWVELWRGVSVTEIQRGRQYGRAAIATSELVSADFWGRLGGVTESYHAFKVLTRVF